MRPLKMSTLVAFLIVLVALAAPAMSGAAEIQIEGKKAAPETSITAKGSLELRYRPTGANIGCTNISLQSKIFQNEHFDVGPFSDYGFFSLRGVSEEPVQRYCGGLGGGTFEKTEWTRLKILDLSAPVSGTFYKTSYIGGPNGPQGAKKEGSFSVEFVTRFSPQEATCTWTGTKIPFSYGSGGSRITLFGNVSSVGGCGSSQLFGSFDLTTTAKGTPVILR